MTTGLFGSKQVCDSCEAVYFDLGEPHAQCPICGRLPRKVRAELDTGRPCFSPPPNLVDMIIDDDSDTLGEDVFDLGVGQGPLANKIIR